MPGVVTCTQVLEALLSAAPFEWANTMMYEKTGPYALAEDPPDAQTGAFPKASQSRHAPL